MKIFTSYYGNGRVLKNNNITQIGISIYLPKWFRGSSIKTVAPKSFMLNDKDSDETYTKKYQKHVLDKLDIKAFLKDVQFMAMGKDVALLCYETPKDFCHRHLLAEFLNEKCDLDIKEFVVERKPIVVEVKTNIQTSLF